MQIRLFISLLLVSVGLQAQSLVLKADAMLDVHSGKLIANPLVVIKDNRILQIGSQNQLSIPEDAKVLELKGQTLLPGLMDMHVHLNSDARLHGYKRLAQSLPRKTLTGVSNARKTIETGFTTVRNVGAPGYADIALRDAIAEGELIGPRIFAAGMSLGITGGHCDNNLLPYEYQDKSAAAADGPWQVREKVRMNVKYGADWIKFCATGGVLSKGTKVGAQQYSQQEMDALVDEASLRGIGVAAHAHGLSGIKAAIRAGVTSVEHASFLDEEAINLALEKGTYLSMDIYTTEYILGEGEKAGILEESLAKERLVGSKQRESFSSAVKAGVKMVFGSDAGVYPHGQNARQFSRMVKFGMTPLQAIQAATINSATMLGERDNLGSLEQGKLADIIAVPGNPLENISLLEQVSWVFKEGQLITRP
ncbi:metal-dependent hydrolase family protein [Lacimicrobium alkaliphilum]|uniref:Xaa-Pro dipeptidase n=1 Tax=Lacimicrobium alkaliphilum TaxID=1526571 RepID=A0A0U2ZIG4_9ALTE|nr:amidohydrolase family protein [Lacimicrobium alkaliphilum]ALS98108.1 Xaa-Pro dipeptidase [Lacimicrobium alkaliphilum]